MSDKEAVKTLTESPLLNDETIYDARCSISRKKRKSTALALATRNKNKPPVYASCAKF